MLEKRIRQHLTEKKILLMTHLVLGYPSFEENRAAIGEMAAAGVELIELQIPFSEPIADGPIILKANRRSLENQTSVVDCIAFAEEICSAFPDISFLFMTYYNIPYVYGEHRFITAAARAGIKGCIIPDLPPEEASDWQAQCRLHQLSNVYIFTPTHTPPRLSFLAAASEGFVYCVGRRGVTGVKTDFDHEIVDQINTYRQATNLPLALGFGVRNRSDIEFLTGKVDIAVIGSKLIELHEQQGVEKMGAFLRSIR